MQKLLENYEQDVIGAEDFHSVLHTYAASHQRITENGERIPWIDEVMHPASGVWSSREIMKSNGWKKELGGFERGKDYNHSVFCDAVLGGLLGIHGEDGRICVSPHVPKEWEYFAVENLWIGEKCFSIYYDKNGDRYRRGKGITVVEA